MYTTVAHNTAQNNSDNLPSYPPHNYHCSNVVYWRGEGNNNCDNYPENEAPTGPILRIRVARDSPSFSGGG